MSSTVYVHVVGFRDVERHALNTVFRLSMDRSAQYVLWTPEAAVSPQLILVDVDSYEGGMMLESPSLNRHVRMICVGARAPDTAWRHFARPLNWGAVVYAMDQLFMGSQGTDLDLDTGDSTPSVPAEGFRATLLVDAAKDRRMYLRARLALAGFVDVKDASDAGEALQLARQRHYDLVIVNIDQSNLEPWKLIDQLISLEPAIGSIVLSSRNATWHMQERAELQGCRGVLEIPFDPVQIQDMLRKI